MGELTSAIKVIDRPLPLLERFLFMEVVAHVQENGKETKLRMSDVWKKKVQPTTLELHRAVSNYALEQANLKNKVAKILRKGGSLPTISFDHEMNR